MPRYDYRCPKGHEFDDIVKIAERHQVACPECGLLGDIIHKPTTLIFFHEGWYEHLGPEPVYVKNMNQLKRICEERGLTSRYVEDSR